jgi:hypothetical protein
MHTTMGFRNLIMEAFSPIITPLNPMPRYHMSTYFAIPQMIGFGHPLEGRLRGYCRGLVPWVPRVTSYDSIIWIRSIPSSGKMAGEP